MLCWPEEWDVPSEKAKANAVIFLNGSERADHQNVFTDFKDLNMFTPTPECYI